MTTMILFNVLLVAVLACLIKPGLLARYTGGEPWPRWIFLVALVVLVYVSPYARPPQEAPQAQAVQPPDSTPSVAPAAAATPVEAAAAAP